MLICADESKEISRSAPKFGQLLDDYRQFTQTVQDNGMMLGANPLQPVATATTVRVRSDKLETTYGPFADTKEQLAGYYLMECENLDEAIECAARIPGAKFGSIEIRPIRKFSEEAD